MNRCDFFNQIFNIHQLMAELECIRLQNQEFKALSCIYLDEFHATKDSTPQKFTILCKPYIGNEGEYQINIMFEFTPSYPRSPLKYEVEPVVGITRDNIQQMTTNIENILYENRNRPIVYDIVQETRYWIHEYLVEGKAYNIEQQEQYKKKQQVFERPKFAAFTPVTEQSFLAWKRQFQLKAQANKVLQKKEGEEKPTGKQWFMGKKHEIEEDDEEDEDQDDDEDDDQMQEQNEQKLQIPRDDVENNDLF